MSRPIIFCLVLAFFSFSFAAQARPKTLLRQHQRTTVVRKHQQRSRHQRFIQTGQASWYGPGFNGKKMANGKKFSQADPTLAAHKQLPLGTRLRVTNLNNHKSIIVTVSDRGPYVRGRILDLSEAAAIRLGFKDDGVTKIRISTL